MTLHISFSIEKTVLVVGESPHCRLQIKNVSTKPLEIFQPLSDGGMPAFRVLNILSGESRIIQGHFESGGIPSTQVLAPGEEIEVSVPLLHTIGLLQLGEYLVSVIYEFDNGRGQSESDPVKVKVNTLAFRNLFLNSVQGSGIFAASINPAEDPPDVVVTSFDLMSEKGVEVVQPVGKAGLQARPIVSLLPNKAPGFGSWVAWINEGALEYVYYDEAIALDPVGKHLLSSADAEIVPPLFIKSSTDYGVRAPGDVILWIPGDVPQGSVVSVINLVPVDDRVVVTPGTKITINGGRPEWARNHARSDGSRLISFIRTAKGKVNLYTLPMPKQGSMGANINVSSLVEWDGDLVSVGATMDLNDVVRGAILIWTGPEGDRKLELIGWSIDTKGGVSEHYRSTVPWAQTVPVGAAKVRVRENGVPAVLLRPVEPDWFVFDGYDKYTPVPGKYKETTLAIDMAFFKGIEVLLICVEPTGVFSVKRLDGRGLPPSRY